MSTALIAFAFNRNRRGLFAGYFDNGWWMLVLELEICNSTGTKCFNIFSDDEGLYIGVNARSSNIYIGGTKTTAPVRIENGTVNIGLDNSNYTRDAIVSMRELINQTSNKIMTDVNAVKI